jgi:hypothetical protein
MTIEQERNWGAEPWREPKIDTDDTVIFSECGRITGSTDYRSHWLVLVKHRFGGYYIYVKHGGGEERFEADWGRKITHMIEAMKGMTSDQRYLTLYVLYQINSNARHKAQEETASYYQLAFLEGRMKRKKRDHRFYVRIEPKIEPATKEAVSA